MGAGNGSRSCDGSENLPACIRSMSRTAVIAPKAASSTAQTMAARPRAKTMLRGTPNVATTGLATMQTATSAVDRKASIHITARNVRS